jgi:hypothetical protein
MTPESFLEEVEKLDKEYKGDYTGDFHEEFDELCWKLLCQLGYKEGIKLAIRPQKTYDEGHPFWYE